MVAGRDVPVYMLVATLVCTWIGSGSLFGTAGLTFRTGISELWFSAGAWVGILVIYMIAARVRRIAQYTLTDLLEKRYSQLAKVLGTITIIIAYMVIAGYQFKGGGRFIAILSDGSITPETGMIIAAVLIVGFHGARRHGLHRIYRHFQWQHHAARDDRYTAVRDHGSWWYRRRDRDNPATQPSHLSDMGGHDFVWVVGIALPTFLLLMSECSMYQKFSSADKRGMRRRRLWACSLVS